MFLLSFLFNNYSCNLLQTKFVHKVKYSGSEFNEFEPRLESAQNWVQLSADLNLETLNTILSRISNLSRGLNSLNSASGCASMKLSVLFFLL